MKGCFIRPFFLPHMVKKMNLDAIKCFICSSTFKTNQTFTLVSLGKERLWFCNCHIPDKKALQHLSDADALSKLVNQKEQFIRPQVFPVSTRLHMQQAEI